MAIDFGALVSRTFQVVWKYKVLWVLGLIVTLLSTNINFSYNANTFNRFNTTAQPDISTAFGGSALLACLAFILLIIFFFVRAGFEAGLIIAGDRAALDRPPTLQEAWAQGRTRMWPIIGLNLIIVAIGIVFALIFVILGFIILGSTFAGIFSSMYTPNGQTPNPSTIFPALGGFFLCFCGLILLAIPLFAVLSVVIQLAQRAVVLDNQTVGQGWSTGWRLLRANAGNVLLLLLIEFGIGIVVGIVIALISGVISLPLMAAAMNGGTGAGGTLLSVVVGIVLWVVTGLLGALPLAGNSVLWTLFYPILTAPGGAGPGQPALYPGGWPPPGPYGAPPASPYGPPAAPGGYTQPGQYPPGYGQPPSGYTQPGQYPGSYDQPPSGYSQPGQYPGGYVPPTSAPGGYGPPVPPPSAYGQPPTGAPAPAPPANPYGPPAGQGGYAPPTGEDRARTERDGERPGGEGTGQ
jgi:hypothetical protein